MRCFEINHVEKDKCTACENCIKLCPSDCYEMKHDNDNVYVEFTNPSNCSFCGKCIYNCPGDAIILKELDHTKFEIDRSLCGACEKCIQISGDQGVELVEEDGKVFAKITDHTKFDKKTGFYCPNQAIKIKK